MKKLIKIKNQLGMSLLGLIITMAALGFGGIYGFQIGLGYLDKNVIQKAVKNILIEQKNNDGATPKVVKDAILLRISTNNINLKNEDIVVVKDGAGFNVMVDFSKEIGINQNMKFVLNFSIDETTP